MPVRKLKVENAKRRIQPKFILLSPPAFINAEVDERVRVATNRFRSVVEITTRPPSIDA
jgi:hypothetical protein